MATNKHVLSIYLKQNDSREQATFLNFGSNFLIFEQLQSNFWVYCEGTFPEFTSTIYSRLLRTNRVSGPNLSLRVLFFPRIASLFIYSLSCFIFSSYKKEFLQLRARFPAQFFFLGHFLKQIFAGLRITAFACCKWQLSFQFLISMWLYYLSNLLQVMSL